MSEREPGRVKKRAFEALDGAKVSSGPPSHSTVCRITDNWMTNRAQVDTDLMCAAGCDCDVEQRNAIEVARESHTRDRMPCPPRLR